MEFMSLNMVKDDQTFLVGSLQSVCVGQAIIHPDREIGRRELMVHLDFQRRGRTAGEAAEKWPTNLPEKRWMSSHGPLPLESDRCGPLEPASGAFPQ